MANVLNELFQDIADSIRGKTGGTETLTPIEFPSAIDGITGEQPNVVLENMEVSLDFTEGDQLISAPDGYVVKSAILKKPDNLVAENIASGVNIAGVVGSFIGSAGGSANVVVATGGFRATSVTDGETYTVTHNLGVIPDFVYVFCNACSNAESALIFATGFSDAFVEKTSFSESARNVVYRNKNGIQSFVDDEGIENGNGMGHICNATATTFNVFGWLGGVPTDGSYDWVAIGGLT